MRLSSLVSVHNVMHFSVPRSVYSGNTVAVFTVFGFGVSRAYPLGVAVKRFF